MATPQIIIDLVDRFERNIEEYKRAHNETQIRREFIDPFFTALGWDVDNKGGAAPQYQDVIHEAQQIVGGSMKAPDYAFRVGGTKKFYVEAKKPSVWVKEAPAPAYQVRSYGWSAKLPVSIVTDFEELAVYDCTQKPKNGDKPSVARINYFTYKDYLTRWDEIESVFSKEAVIKGQFDRYAETNKGKRGTTTVDKAFLIEIESWRELLAKNFAKNNKITEDELKFATQRTLDRIIFLRICEARGIEEEGRLQEAIAKPNAFKELFTLFQAADNRYNSGLFYFRKGDKVHKTDAELDTITPKLKLDDKILKEVIAGLYYPSPYKFDVIPADILGQVYEQFLGKVIRMTSGGMVKIEEKPEVRKAGGVYYTPTYIVDYIVKNTVGEILNDPKRTNIKILDPACGSGSFLLGAYDYLLKWNLEQYTKDAKTQLAKKNSPIYEVSTKNYALTTSEKKRILLEHIYGVDIDENAVEVAKLNLMLKCLEGEGAATLKLSVERILPDLSDNIKCGNSLIGSDFNDGLFSNDEHKKINPFDWNTEFADIMKKGGFDAVIGNPPWGASFDDDSKKYLVKQFPIVPSKTKDSYFYFLFNTFKIAKQNAMVGMILPNTWLLINNANSIREELLKYKIYEIVDLGDGVFKKAIVESSTIIVQKVFDDEYPVIARREKRRKIISENEVHKKTWLQDPLKRIVLERDDKFDNILIKTTNKSELFGVNCEIIFGIKPYQVGYGTPPQTREMVDMRIYHSTSKESELWKPLVVGGNVNRYSLLAPPEQYIKYGKWLMYFSDEKKILAPKILLRRTSDTIRVSYDDKSHYPQNSLFIVTSKKFDLKYLISLLNSKLFDYIYKKKCPQVGKIFAEVKPSIIKELPIKEINPNNKQIQDTLVSLVDRMLTLNKELPLAKTPNDKTRIERQLSATDKEIDNLIYELYGLTEEEIKIVENN